MIAAGHFLQPTNIGTLILLQSRPNVYCECSPLSSSPALLVLLLNCEAIWIAVHVQEVNLKLQILELEHSLIF